MIQKLVGLLLGIGLVSTAGATLSDPTPASEPTNMVELVNISPINVQSSTSDMLAKLAMCESGNRTNIRIVDTNGEFSTGLFQFQDKTFLAFGKKYGILPADLELNEVENIIYDPDLQREIAGRMIEDGLLLAHWKICGERISGRIVI